MTDLNDLVSNGSGWTLTYATAINQGGQIVGYGTTPDRLIHAYLLTPDQLPTGAGRSWINVSSARAISQPQADVDSAVALPTEPSRPPAPLATLAGPAVYAETTPAATTRITARHAQDAAFTGWCDPLANALALTLLG
jgi:probable HAF family extracellular repeat protein